ncbi:peptidase inhibitor family I36 protein [Streptomyces sp. NPDC000348]|uniref:peptidase inhibitor family I36 protein n=1 Tax=Streptomyces sp. NPDC000348 TaxID=3364538 RepID=UPI0036BE2BA3
MKKSRLGAVAMTIAGTAAMVGISAAPAQAGTAGYNLCAEATDLWSNRLCLFYNSDQQGSFAGFTKSVADLEPWIFGHIGTTTAGQGQPVKNNAASAANPGSPCWRVYYNSNYAGPSDTINGYSYRQLVNTYNENASVKVC